MLCPNCRHPSARHRAHGRLFCGPDCAETWRNRLPSKGHGPKLDRGPVFVAAEEGERRIVPEAFNELVERIRNYSSHVEGAD